MKIAVIGASGRVGRLISHRLYMDKHSVIAIDPNDNCEYGIPHIRDGYKNTKNYADCDLVVNCVPGNVGFDSLETIISSGKNVIDISFMPEDPYELDELAKQHNVFALVDAGWAPGLTNIIVGHELAKSEIDSVKIMVGGLPVKRNLPWEYSTMFSPEDVIEEYIRKVRLLDGGAVIEVDPLTDCELIETSIGTLEAFNTDGLRTLLRNCKDFVLEMKEKTIRYPGYANKVMFLKDSGFFIDKEITVNGKRVKPIDMTSKILIDAWNDEGVNDVSVMRVETTEYGGSRKNVYDMIDYKSGDFSSMSRVTGSSCCSMISLINKYGLTKTGIVAPEDLCLEIKDAYNYIANYLHNMGIIIRESTKKS